MCDFLNQRFRDSVVLFVPCSGTNAIDFTILDVYIEDSTICFHDHFYTDVENALNSKFGLINLRYNNTKSCFWHHLIKEDVKV